MVERRQIAPLLAAKDARALYPEKLVLARPDQHVAWRGDALPADLDTLFARLCGDTPVLTSKEAFIGVAL